MFMNAYECGSSIAVIFKMRRIVPAHQSEAGRRPQQAVDHRIAQRPGARAWMPWPVAARYSTSITPPWATTAICSPGCAQPKLHCSSKSASRNWLNDSPPSGENRVALPPTCRDLLGTVCIDFVKGFALKHAKTALAQAFVWHHGQRRLSATWPVRWHTRATNRCCK